MRLKGASPAATHVWLSASLVGGWVASAGTTTAQMSSPLMGWGSPMTATSATPGWTARADSSSAVEMFSPLRMMISLSRPVMVTWPSLSSMARSPVRT